MQPIQLYSDHASRHSFLLIPPLLSTLFDPGRNALLAHKHGITSDYASIMSAAHHEFADSESAAFLYNEGDDKRDQRPSTPKAGLWTRIGRYVPYVLLALGILLALLIVVSSPKDRDGGSVTSILPSQAMFGKSMSSPYRCSAWSRVFHLLTT